MMSWYTIPVLFISVLQAADINDSLSIRFPIPTVYTHAKHNSGSQTHKSTLHLSLFSGLLYFFIWKRKKNNLCLTTCAFAFFKFSCIFFCFKDKICWCLPLMQPASIIALLVHSCLMLFLPSVCECAPLVIHCRCGSKTEQTVIDQTATNGLPESCCQRKAASN